MSKIRKGATVVLKLDELYLWIRKQNQQNNTNGHIKNGKNKTKTKSKNNNKNSNLNSHRFKIVNRPLDFNKLPPCRAKIIYMGIPKFLKQKKVIFGVQLYPPYFGLTQRVYKSINTRKVLGKIQSKEFKSPIGSIWFITENDIKGVMLRNTPRRISKGATQMTNHLGSPHIGHTDLAQNLRHLNMRSSSKSPKFNDEQKQQNGNNGNKMFDSNNKNNNNNNHNALHFRRKSSFSMSCHYRNMESLQNINDLDSMVWEDTNLPSDYNLAKRKKLNEDDPKERRFKLDRWLYPIFLDFHDQQTTEIVKDRCQWELTQWIRDEAEGVRTPMLRQFYDYMISLSDNLDAIFIAISNKYVVGDNDNDNNDNDDISSNDEYDVEEEDELKEYREIERPEKLAKLKKAELNNNSNQERELWELDEINFQFEMMTRIKELTECVEDALEAKFVLNVIEALENDVFFASPILQCIIKYIGNDIKFMIILRENCRDKVKCIEILESMERYNRNGSPLPIVWKLVDICDGDEMLIEKILINTNNVQEDDPETLTIGLLNALDNNLDIVQSVFEVIVDGIRSDSNGYIFHHIGEILKMCESEIKTDKTVITETMVKFGIGHPLISPFELFINWKKHKTSPIIDQLNILSSMQLKYEQYQLFLGRYLLYCPFTTKAVKKGQFDDYKADQDEVEFYDEDEVDDDDDTTALLIEFTIDIDNISTKNHEFVKKLIIKKSLCVKNYDTLEYEPHHYYEDELCFKWDLINYNEKILQLNNTRCQWIPNLKNISSINPSYQIPFNPEDLSNELRGYLVLLPDKNGKLTFIDDLFKKWNVKNKQQNQNKYTEVVHKMKERPIFISMEKWKLTDNY